MHRIILYIVIGMTSYAAFVIFYIAPMVVSTVPTAVDPSLPLFGGILFVGALAILGLLYGTRPTQ